MSKGRTEKKGTLLAGSEQDEMSIVERSDLCRVRDSGQVMGVKAGVRSCFRKLWVGERSGRRFGVLRPTLRFVVGDGEGDVFIVMLLVPSTLSLSNSQASKC